MQESKMALKHILKLYETMKINQDAMRSLFSYIWYHRAPHSAQLGRYYSSSNYNKWKAPQLTHIVEIVKILWFWKIYTETLNNSNYLGKWKELWIHVWDI